MPRSRRPPAPRLTRAEEAEARATRRARAAEEPLDVRPRTTEPLVELEIRNPLHQTSYRVFFPCFPDRECALCTCADFARRGLGTCKHLEAANDWLARHPTLERVAAAPSVSPGSIWRELRRRLDARPAVWPREIRDLEALGRVLIDPVRREK